MGRSQKRDGFGVPLDNFKGLSRYNQATHRFELGGLKFSCNELKPLEQVHIARKLAPILLGALKPEEGRKAILARIAGMAKLATAQEAASTTGGANSEASANEQVIADALDLATSIFGAAAETSEEMVNAIIRKVMSKVHVELEGGGIIPAWNERDDIPSHEKIDGFLLLALVSRYLFEEFKDRIVEYIASLNLKPGPALMAAAAGRQRPPGAPGEL